MRLAARRLQAFILAAVLLVGGGGASALDVVLYHLGGHVEVSASRRVAGTDAPRPHGDACALLDWAARGPYTPALDAPAAVVATAGTRGERAFPVFAPRPADLSAAPRPRAPPLQPT